MIVWNNTFVLLKMTQPTTPSNNLQSFSIKVL